MRWRATLLLGLLAILPVSAEDWTTADGKTYQNVTIVEQTDGGVRITYTGGVGIIPDYELPLDVQKRLGVDFDSLQAKKKAAQQAADEAARNAAAASAAADAAAAAVAKANPQAAANAATQPGGANPTTSAPGTQPGSTTPGASASATATTASPSAPGSPAALTNAPGTTATAGATAAAGTTAGAGAPGAAVPSDINNPYPGSTYTYDESVDTCYLVSPTVLVALVPSDATKPPLAGQGALALRVESDGLKPAAPDQIEATFHGVGAPPVAGVDHHIKFLVDGNYIPAEEIPPADGDTTGNISFYFSPAQAKSIFTGHNVNFSIAKNNYRVDEDGISVFRKYLDTVNRLQPAPVSFTRTIHKFVAHLPPITAILSTICEYVIFGGAGLIVLIALMMFAIGTRAIIKW